MPARPNRSWTAGVARRGRAADLSARLMCDVPITPADVAELHGQLDHLIDALNGRGPG